MENDEEIKVTIRTGTSTNPPVLNQVQQDDIVYEVELVFDIIEWPVEHKHMNTRSNARSLLSLNCEKYTTPRRETMCSICLSDFKEGDNVSVLPKCKHTFHYDCLADWIKLKNNCPLCRLKI
jgi:hypothetical protein